MSRYCLAHARCPVLTVPPPSLARETRRAALARAFWHRTLTADQISPDNGQPRNPPAAASRTQHPGFGPASAPPRPTST